MDGPRRVRGGDTDQVWGGDGNDRITASHGEDRLLGGAGNDSIESLGASNDILLGGDGDDQFTAEIGNTAGPQNFDGGPGTNTLRLNTDAINPEAFASTGVWDMATGAMTFTNANTIALSASHFEGAILETFGTAWTVTGTAGDDVVSGNENQTAPTRFDGLTGDDSFTGTDGDDVFNGGPGDDHSFGMFLGDDTCTSVETIDLSDCENVS